MSDEKNFNEENEEVTVSAEEAVEETAETAESTAEETAEAVEETTAAVEEAVEEAQGEFIDAQSAQSALGDNTDGTDDAVSTEGEEGTDTIVDAVQAETDSNADDPDTIAGAEQTVTEGVEGAEGEVNVKTSKSALIAVIAAAVLIVALIVVGLVVYGPSLFNKYNRMGYIDTSGRTVGEVAEAMGMEYSEFLEMYGLPEDMPKNTTESAAYNNIPLSNMAKTYGASTEEFKEILQLGDDSGVTDDTTWGEAINKVTLGAYVGEEYLAEFKEYYGLGDDVTVDTLWGDVRQTVEKKQRDQRIEREKEEAKATEAPVAEGETAEATEAPAAEGEAAGEATEAPAAEAPAEAPAA